MTGTDWALSACNKAGLSLFFPPGDDERHGDKVAREAQAKAICRGCPVRYPCLELALQAPDASQYGIWGATNETERIQLRRRRRRAAAARKEEAA
jgi:WhiB family transcriptional regulator, redox-sensing transcriptional regulator